MLNLIILLVVGAVIGWLAGLLMKVNFSLVVCILVGIAGSYIGSLIAGWLGIGVRGGGFDIVSLLFGVIGACLLTAVLKLFHKK